MSAYLFAFTFHYYFFMGNSFRAANSEIFSGDFMIFLLHE